MQPPPPPPPGAGQGGTGQGGGGAPGLDLDLRRCRRCGQEAYLRKGGCVNRACVGTLGARHNTVQSASYVTKSFVQLGVHVCVSLMQLRPCGTCCRTTGRAGSKDPGGSSRRGRRRRGSPTGRRRRLAKRKTRGGRERSGGRAAAEARCHELRRHPPARLLRRAAATTRKDGICLLDSSARLAAATSRTRFTEPILW